MSSADNMLRSCDMDDLTNSMRSSSISRCMSSTKSQKVTCAEVRGKKLEKLIYMAETVLPSIKLDLPLGSSTVNHTLYNMINIPAVDPIEPSESNAVVPQMVTKHMIDSQHRKAFPDVNHLNLIQSATFSVAYGTDENILVCAPTGSGKTFIALLCILHELHHFESVEEFKKTPFKIIYIAPMKALAGEIRQNLSDRLQFLGLTVREFTGDQHLRAQEIHDADILVATPEKWDNITRRNTSSESLFTSVQLLIIDEVHLLNCDRGPVLEAIVARTFRLRSDKNSRLRVVGLSATLPNYKEIAQFLHVNPDKGLFYFNWGFRPVPLQLTFVGSKNSRFEKHWGIEDKVCYNKLMEFVKKGQKVLIFVLSRAKAISTASYITKRATEEDDLVYLQPTQSDHDTRYEEGLEILEDSNMNLLKTFYKLGVSCHHAGMLREDRIRVEKLFREGYIKVLVSTTTLAWGVNLPAHAVIIKGTRYYNPARSGLTEIDLLEAQQMFGRAGRPQYDTLGEAVLITNQINLPYYLSILHWQIPIQSHLITSLTDHLNAEIVLKSVTNIDEGVEWLKHTFLYVRMTNQPDHYNVKDNDVVGRCRQLIHEAAAQLVRAGMVIYDQRAGTLQSTDIGAVASYTYINRSTVEIINTCLNDTMSIDALIFLLCKSKEFENIKVRPVESHELRTLMNNLGVNLQSQTSPEGRKIAVLIYCHMRRLAIENVQLYLDQIYIVHDAKRILRAYFEIAVIKRFASTAKEITLLQKCLLHRCCNGQPLLQFKRLSEQINSPRYKNLSKLSLNVVKTLSLAQIEILVESRKLAHPIVEWVKSLPFVKLSVTCFRMTPDFIRIHIKVTPDFEWNPKYNGMDLEPWVAWVINPLTKEMYPPLHFSIRRRHVERKDTISLDMNVMLSENSIPEELILHSQSETWLGVEIDHKIAKGSFLPTGFYQL